VFAYLGSACTLISIPDLETMFQACSRKPFFEWVGFKSFLLGKIYKNLKR